MPLRKAAGFEPTVYAVSPDERWFRDSLTRLSKGLGAQGGRRTRKPKRWFLRPVCLPISPPVQGGSPESRTRRERFIRALRAPARRDPLVRGKRIELFSLVCKTRAVTRRRAPRSSGRASRTRLFSIQSRAILASRRSRSGDPWTRTTPASLMRAASRLASSP